MKPKIAVIAASFLCAGVEAQTWLAPVKMPVRYGLENEAGVMITEAKFDELVPQGSDAFLARTVNGYGVINPKGEWIISDKYRKIVQYRNGKAVVAKPAARDKSDRQRGYYYGNDNDSILKMGVADKNGTLLSEYNWALLVIGPDENMLVSADGKTYGFLDAQGKELLPVSYDFASVFREERAVVSTGGKHGKQRMDLLFGGYEKYGNADNSDYTGGAWEVINTKGEKVTIAAFDYIRDYKESRAAFNKGGMWNTYKRYDYGDPKLTGGSWGFLDLSGKEIISAQYDYAGDFENGVAQVTQGERTFYIDVNGKETAAPAKKTKTFPYPHVYCKQGYAGYIDPTGKMVIPAIYQAAEEFSEGLAAVIPVKKEANCGDNAPDWFRELYIEHSNAIYTDGDVYRPRIFRKLDMEEALSHIRDSLLMDSLTRAHKDNKTEGITDYFGYIDKTGKLLIPAQFDMALPFHNDRAYVRIGERWGIIDKNGNWIMKPILENMPAVYAENDYDVESYEDYIASPLAQPISYMFSEGMGLIYKYQKYGFVNEAGKIIVAPIYDEVNAFAGGVAAVKLGGKWGFIDKAGKLVIPLKFTEANAFSEGLALVRHAIISEEEEENTSDYDRERFGYIDMKGNWVVPPTYRFATSFKEGTAAVSKSWNSYTFIDKTGRAAFPGTYASAAAFENGFARVTKAGESAASYIDHKGKVSKLYSPVFPPPDKAPLQRAENKVSECLGYRNAKNEWVIPATYENTGRFTIAD